jgi:hypothetical protein
LALLNLGYHIGALAARPDEFTFEFSLKEN